MKKYTILMLSLLIVIISAEYFVFSGENDRDQRQVDFKEKYAIYALELPTDLKFAGEAVPMDDIDVRERYDRELLINTYWQSSTLLLIKRAHRWFPVIEPILKANNIPDDFKFLALAESGLTNAVSPAGATGYWQFLKSTGQSYGLEINSEIDERYNVEKSTEAACRYIQDAHNKFGSWSMAAASYNMGMEGLSKQKERQQSSQYWDLLLNEETSRYVFRITSLKEIIKNPEKYGFHIRKRDMYPAYEFEIERVNYPISDFAVFAHERKINYKQLKLLNPWLRDNLLTNKYGKTYEIKLLRSNAGLPDHED